MVGPGDVSPDLSSVPAGLMLDRSLQRVISATGEIEDMDAVEREVCYFITVLLRSSTKKTYRGNFRKFSGRNVPINSLSLAPIPSQDMCGAKQLHRRDGRTYY